MKIIYIAILSLFLCNNVLAAHSCASINPIYGILANITQGIDKPDLILDKPFSNLHDYNFTPQDIMKIKSCDFIFTISRDFESFIGRLHISAKKNAKLVELSKAEKITLLETRENNIYEEEDSHDHEHLDYDLHLWLDIDNTKAMALMIAKTLSDIDYKNKDAYLANVNSFVKKLDQLDQELKEKLSPIKKKPYIVFHDAYQYFEERYGLSPAGAILINNQHNPGAKALSEIKELVNENKVRCIFKEPQFPDRIVDRITQSSKVKSSTLNAEWADAEDATELYFVLMRNMADSLVNCLN